MLKGLKIKSKQEPEKLNPEDPLLLFQELDSKKKKKWKKEEPNDTDKLIDETPEEIEQRQLKERLNLQTSLNECSKDLWNSFIQGNIKQSAKICQKLFNDQQKYFQNIFYQDQITTLNDQPQQNQEILDDEMFEDPNRHIVPMSDVSKSIKQAHKKEEGKGYNYDYMTQKFFTKFNKISHTDDQYDQMDENDEKMTDKQKLRQSKMDSKYEAKQEKHHKSQLRKTDRILSNCKLCFANKHIIQDQIISMGTHTMLIIPNYNRYRDDYFYFYIIPIEHYSSQLELDEDIYQEVRNFQKCLVSAFDQINMCVVFFEAATNVRQQNHLMLECVAVPQKYYEELPKYFKNMLTDVEGNWSTHQNIIKIEKQKGGLRKQIPKNFSYFYVDFNTAFGYAHVVENESKFDRLLHHEIMSSMLEIDKLQVLRPEWATRDQLKKQKSKFQRIWDHHDWTKHNY